MSSSSVEIRHASEQDLSSIVGIYNYYVENDHATFDTTPYDVDSRMEWLRGYKEGTPYQLFVACSGGGIMGYASSSQLKPRAAYDSSVETTVYVDPDATGQGIGRLLYEALIDRLTKIEPLHRAYGGIALPNDASVRLHESLGFRHYGTQHEVGYKFGKYWDVALYEKDLPG